MNWVALFGLGAIFALGIAQAQKLPTPTDIELKAAYCLQVTQIIVAASRNQPQVSDPELQNTIKDAQDRADRLRSYLASKELDPAATLAAAKRAERDEANSRAEVGKLDEQCEPICRNATLVGMCLSECAEPKRDKQLADRLRSCWKLDWLPF